MRWVRRAGRHGFWLLRRLRGSLRAQMMIARLLYHHRAWFRSSGCRLYAWLVPLVVDVGGIGR